MMATRTNYYGYVLLYIFGFATLRKWKEIEVRALLGVA